MLKRFASMVSRLQSTAGRLEKESILREYESDAEVREILNFLFNPYIVSGISDKKLNRLRSVNAMPQVSAVPFTQVLDYFKQHNTGRDEDIMFLITAVAQYDDPQLVELAYSIIKQDLRLGIQAVTLNKVYGEGFIPVFDVMKAERYVDNKEVVEGRDFIITEKLDGVRCVLIFQGGGGHDGNSEQSGDGATPMFYSRNGRTIDNLEDLTKAVQALDKKFVYDGELLLRNDKNLPSKDLYRETVRVTSSDNIKKNLIFNIFDKVEKSDFISGQSARPCIERKNDLHKELEIINKDLPAPILKEVEALYIGRDTEKIAEWLVKMTSQDKEGIMLNLADASYECKRTKGILKVKQFNTADVLVESIEEGKGANRGKVGAVIVRFIGPDGREYTCRVGSGFKAEERDYYFKNPNKLVGKIIEIGYFEISRNIKNDEDYSLRFPTFKSVRNDKNEISMY